MSSHLSSLSYLVPDRASCDVDSKYGVYSVNGQQMDYATNANTAAAAATAAATAAANRRHSNYYNPDFNITNNNNNNGGQAPRPQITKL